MARLAILIVVAFALWFAPRVVRSFNTLDARLSEAGFAQATR